MKYLSAVILLSLLIGCSTNQRNLTITADNPLEIEEYSSVVDRFEPIDNNNIEYKDSSIESNSIELEYKKKRRVEPIPSFDESGFHDFKLASNVTQKPKIIVNGKNVKVNIESIPLHEFIDFIFSSVLKVNYTVDKKVKALKQPINLNMSEPLAKQELFYVVEKILKKESVVLNKENGTIFVKLDSVQKVKDNLSDKYIFFGRTIPQNISDDKQVMIFVPYTYTQPKQSFKILKRLGTGHVYFSYLKNNIQILDGKAKDVRQTLEMISVIDSVNIAKKEPYLIELENIEVKKFKNELVSILKSNSIPIVNNIDGVGLVLTEIKELNGLLVLTPKQSWLDMILFWKDKLDVLSEVETEYSKLYSYKVKYRKVDELAKVLSDVLSVIDNRDSVGRDNNRTNINLNMNTHKTAINIKSDLHTNTLMMSVTPAQYKKILPVIKKLDSLPLQVMVEVILAEVTMTDEFSLGFDWALRNNNAITGTPTQISGASTLGLGGAGVASNIFTTNLSSVINAFAKQNKLEILSRPRLVILNNKSGNINVGKQVPVVSSEASSAELSSNSSSSILRNITYVSTGMTLNLTPTINSNGSLTLDINVQLSEAQINGTSKIDSPLIVNRSLTTSAVMQSGNSILLGGIISHNKSDGHGGVPFLQDLPWIGNAFKSQSENHVKTELIILIKPKILKNNIELYEETKKFKILLKTLKNL